VAITITVIRCSRLDSVHVVSCFIGRALERITIIIHRVYDYLLVYLFEQKEYYAL